jgi:hypothetical protein
VIAPTEVMNDLVMMASLLINRGFGFVPHHPILKTQKTS